MVVTIVSYFGQATATLNQLTNRVNDHLEARGKQSTIVTARGTRKAENRRYVRISKNTTYNVSLGLRFFR